MAKTLLVDDKKGLVRSLRDLAEQGGVSGVEYFTSLGEARGAAQAEAYDRFIADQFFEGEEDDGLTFLEDMKAERTQAEVFLLTGQPVTTNVENRLRALGGRLIKKQELDSLMVESLLGGREAVRTLEVRPLTVESTDVGELRLEVEALRDEIDQLRELNDLLVEDIIVELQAIPDQEEKAMLIGDRLLTPQELRFEVERRTTIGREMIRLHHELFRMLRER